MVEDGVGGRELARCTRTAQGDGGGGVEDGVGVRGEDYCWQHIPCHIPREVTRAWRLAVYLCGFGLYTHRYEVDFIGPPDLRFSCQDECTTHTYLCSQCRDRY